MRRVALPLRCGDRLSDAVDAALRVGEPSRRSVRYEIALLRAGAEPAVATGCFVHVFGEILVRVEAAGLCTRISLDEGFDRLARGGGPARA